MTKDPAAIMAAAYAAARGVEVDEAASDALFAAYATAQSEYPGVVLSADAYGRAVAAHVPPERLSEDCLADLYLAAACLTGDDAAIRTFETKVWPSVEGGLRKIAREVGDVDELAQRVRVKLLVGGADEDAALSKYAGRGALGGWARVVATRFALNARRAVVRRKETSEHPPDLTAGADADPELRHLRARHAEHFKAAFEAAVAELGAEARNMLRFHYLERLTIDQIGAACGIHRVTAFRHLEKARQELVVRTRDRLRVTLKVSEGELQSVLRALDGEVELSLTRLFGDDPPAP